jgi:hypothetical protein
MLRRLAFVIALVCFALTAAGVLLLILNAGLPDRQESFGYQELLPVLPLTFTSVGILLGIRVPRNPIGWLFIFVGLCSSVTFFVDEYSNYGLFKNQDSIPGVELSAWVASWAWVPLIGIASVFLTHLFPDGRSIGPVWRRIALAGGAGIAVATIATALQPGPLEEFPGIENPLGIAGARDSLGVVSDLGLSVMAFAAASGAVSQFVRYRRSPEDERHQIKWFMAAAAVVALTFVLVGLAPGDRALAQVIETTFIFAISLIPVATGIAVLRYRLYDIDELINRTLVYVPLTAGLAGVFVAVTGLIRAVFTELTNTGSDAAIAFSTLLVVALLTPAKNQLQALVDRHFKEAPDPAKALRSLTDQARAILQVVDTERFLDEFLREVVAAFGASGGALVAGSRRYEAGVPGHERALVLPLEHDGRTIGELGLGRRSDGRPYTSGETSAIAEALKVAASVAALHSARSPAGLPAE